MVKEAAIPHPIRRGYNILCRSGVVEITDVIRRVDEGGESVFRFFYNESVVTPNPEEIPDKVSIRVDIPCTFPCDGPKIFSNCKEVQGFPHQDAETGKLCLFDDSRIPRDEQRLLTHIQWTKEWLNDAAMGQLLRAGDPYEIPDFSRRNLRKRLDLIHPVYTTESAATWALWADKIGKHGEVDFRSLNCFKGISPWMFYDESRCVIAEFGFNKSLIDPKGLPVSGVWAMLGSLCYRRHRPPQTFGELALLCTREKIDLDLLLRNAFRFSRDNDAPCVILFGFPMPEKVGADPVRVHWQPLFIDGIRKQFHNHHSKKCNRIKVDKLYKRSRGDGEYADYKPLLWGDVINVSDSTLYSRGALPSCIRALKVSICGCGAIGSIIAECLARGGVKNIELFDIDEFEIGNQCRHTLSGSDIGEFKSKALAERLQSCNPFSNIHGNVVRFPISDKVIARGDQISEALLSSDVILDCGISEGGFQWVSQEAKRRGIRMFTVFFNLHAQILTVCASGKRISCFKALRRLNRDILAGKAPLSYAEYNPLMTSAEKVLPDIGCWHATFPAVNNHIGMLVNSGIEVVCAILGTPSDDHGRAVIVRRSSLVDISSPSALTEILWSAKY